MSFTLTSELSDGLLIIGLITMMNLLICPLFVWVLTWSPASPEASHPSLRGKAI